MYYLCFVDYEFSQSGNSWSLEICDIEASQAGTYSATATNTGGSVSCQCVLTVESKHKYLYIHCIVILLFQLFKSH